MIDFIANNLMLSLFLVLASCAAFYVIKKILWAAGAVFALCVVAWLAYPLYGEAVQATARQQMIETAKEQSRLKLEAARQTAVEKANQLLGK